VRKAEVYRNDVLAGILIEENSRNFVFEYDEKYFLDNSKPFISLTLPKTQKTYQSKFLFPFFANMLSEGVNRRLQNVLLKIDEKDDFGLLMATAKHDTIGAITVKPVTN
jgi:serine/threonine-protein kinase HipA